MYVYTMNTQMNFKDIIFTCLVMAAMMLPFSLAVIPFDLAKTTFRSVPIFFVGLLGFVLLIVNFKLDFLDSLKSVFIAGLLTTCINPLSFIVVCLLFNGKASSCAKPYSEKEWIYVGIAFTLYAAITCVLKYLLKRRSSDKNTDNGEINK